ncbi:MAG: hydrogen gas-evolving membrane-bound hydrogenase subunit E [Rubrimonas sp.]|uniref:hydrogen gas-evolving membrane-bound hydrogenase subunit E n=1 Tax=Rubrimonas sp. TaxID=2036015 RepID=UPI002FDE437A
MPDSPSLRAAAPAGLWRNAPALLSALAATWFAGWAPAVSQGATPTWAVDWAPAFGVALAFRLDGLSLTFALLATGVGAAVLLYAAEYFRADPRLKRLLVLLGLFEIAMVGLVLADDAISLFLFWEATTVISWLLVGFDHHKAEARAKALTALLVTGLGGLALLAGLVVLAMAAGTWRLSEMAAIGADLRAHPAYLGFLIPILIGCFTKSAQFPFHFWLPGAMAAPTPVSAYLHSATMVKAGVYLLARLSPELGGTEVWSWSLTLSGGATMLLGAIWALRQTDLKLMLAYTTVSGLGSIVMFLGSREPVAIVAASTFIVVHAFYKAALFLMVGVLDKKAGSRTLGAVEGLRGRMPVAWAISLAAGFSMAGFPPLLGFIGKELKYEGALAVATEPLIFAGAAVLSNAMVAAVGCIVALKPFLGKLRAPASSPREAPWPMLAGPAALALASLGFGIAPGALDALIVQPMAVAIRGEGVEVQLKLWHGLNLPLLLSVLTFALTAAGFVFRARLRRGLMRIEPFLPWASAGFDRGLAGLKALAALTEAALAPGRLASHLRVMLGAMAALLLGGLALGARPPSPGWPQIDALEAGLIALTAVGALIAPFARGRLAALTALGVSGAGVAAIFALFGGIDLAMTQLLVETLIVVVAAVALLRLPQMPRAGVRPVAVAIAVAAGVGVTLAIWAALAAPFDPAATRFFEAASWPEALGRNIVNVILVDFRALDTLGEIVVVALAAIAAVAALKGGRRA